VSAVGDGTVLTVRAATQADVAAIRAVVEAAYQPYVARIGRPPAPVGADYAGRVSRGEVWVATADAAVVGLVVLIARPGYLLLENVAVHPSAQRRGVGARLLALAEQHAARLRLTEIRLYTNVAMTENLAYYPRRGYRETGRGDEDGFQRVYFSKRLDEHAQPSAVPFLPPKA
jgi:ribosomal protein S18 acetylase RimI-like enzyme